jgi:hypothetical protein
MTDPGDARDAVARHLHEAIERVRKDVEAVEFWADAVAGFSRPVPRYEPEHTRVWVPQEQATQLGNGRPHKRRKSRARR